MLIAARVSVDRLVASCYDDDGLPVPGRSDVCDPTELRALADLESARWIWDSAPDVHAALVTDGVQVRRCHDIALAERVLLGRVGRFGEPRRAAAVLARARGEAAAPDPDPRDALRNGQGGQLDLFDDGASGVASAAGPAGVTCDDLVAAYLDQQQRLSGMARRPAAIATGISVSPGALKLLLAAESGSGLVAAEISRRGLPWDLVIHDAILTELLGPRPPRGQRPPVMAQLAGAISDALGFVVNPDSPLGLREAFHRSGVDVESTRAAVLRELDHPAVPPLLRYKELARLHSANGWQWAADWVHDGRLIGEYLPGAVVSGRWATSGGGGLQIPAVLRPAAVAEPGHVLVAADGAQLEPRIWAAVSKDPALTALSTEEDLYQSLADGGFGGDRRHAKLAMLGAMYGQTSGEAARLMATMRKRYPRAVTYVERAARSGANGQVVASVLGRACPPPSTEWRRLVTDPGDDPARRDQARRAMRDRGRFTRNFVIQASAADWAAVWMTMLRLALLEVPGAEIVLFQHDEIVMHVPTECADEVSRRTVMAANQARDLVFPGSAVHTPVRPIVARCYADAK